ncbi:MAG: flippase-like domain-containing protein [Candidatus Eisenbacteria sp.]|nr:flippase-like domain-containing protein [Candidatus Eisenbacteria bacterium]
MAGSSERHHEPPGGTIRLPSRRAIAWGIQLFILISIGAITIGFWWKSPANLNELLANLDWRFALLIIPLVGIDYLVGGLRYRALFNGRVLTKVSLWDCMRSNWANIFMGAATPMQTGGGAAQVYLLWRSGAPVSEGVLASLVNFAGTLVFFVCSSLAALLLIPTDLFGPKVTGLIQGAFVIVALVAVLVLGVVIFPRIGLWIIRQLYDRLLARIPRLGRARDRVIGKAEHGVERFSGAVGHVGRRGRGSLALVVLLTLILFSNKFTIAYAVVRALGHEVPYSVFLGLKCVHLFVIYFAPTPGASGVAEVSSVWLMERVIPSELLLIYTVLWRLFTTVIGAVIGGFVLLLDVHRVGVGRVRDGLQDRGTAGGEYGYRE